jgi:two-component system NtrC family sensor kinase
LINGSPEAIRATLAEHLRAVPYFEQFVLVASNGESIAGFPVADLKGLQPGSREQDALALAFDGIPLQYFSIPPIEAESDVAQLSFVAALRAGDGSVPAVLLGRTHLGSNPFAQPILQSLRGMEAIEGQGILLDGEGQIVYHPNPASILAPYNGRRGDAALTYEDTTSDGARRRVLYLPATGSNWAVVSQLPVGAIQQWAVDIALPMLAMLAMAALLAYVMLRRSLRTVTASLQELVQETRRIAAGDLNAPLSQLGADEIGRLGEAFERMRQALKTRLEEIQRLLSVSQGVAGSLDLRSQIDPILEAALVGGASAVRLVFANPGALDSDEENNHAFGGGPLGEVYRSLDAQMLALTDKQPRVLITNPARARLHLAKDIPQPLALAAFALQDEGRQLGALWLAFDEPQNFEPEGVRYLETLARQAALAAANATLYLSARLGRERVEAVLTATPDPVLVTDEGGRLLLANPAAIELLDLAAKAPLGRPIAELLDESQPDLLGLLTGGKRQETAAELSFPDGRVFYATAINIEIEGQEMGRTCVLREITQFKQVEALRSEFLSTVSHDLRDPLKLTRGYLSMLDMVGSLNEKQASYAQKIEQSIDSMSRLVSNLLDLERIQSDQGLQLDSFSVSELLEDVKKELEPRALQKQVDLKLELPEAALPVLQADRTLLQRAFYNLLDNAIKFSPRSSQVEIWLSPSDEAITLGFRDHGAGIAPVDLPHIFNRMYRPANQATGRSGGLGLAIVKSIVERHNGRVWVESELGLGSTFYCLLPLKAGGKTPRPD